MQRSQATTHALADDALRAAEVGCDLGVAALLEVVGLDRLALLGESASRVARPPERLRSSRGSRSPRHRVDRLHRERTPRLVLNTTAAQRLAQLVARDREQPRLRRLWSGLKTRHRGECGGEGLGGEIKCFLRAAAPGGERRQAPKRSAARRRRRTAQSTCAPRAEARCRSIAPRSSCVLYDDFTRFVTGVAERQPPRTGVYRAGEKLSAAERQVAELAASGATHREIAAALFMSVKTVEAHLSRVYRKLNVRSRTQLASHISAAV